MKRAPYQILVLPFRTLKGGNTSYAISRRADCGAWQGLAGGGESNESPLESAAAKHSKKAEYHIPIFTSRSIRYQRFQSQMFAVSNGDRMY